MLGVWVVINVVDMVLVNVGKEMDRRVVRAAGFLFLGAIAVFLLKGSNGPVDQSPPPYISP